MRVSVLILFFLFLFSEDSVVLAQSRKVVFLLNKDQNPFSLLEPEEFLSKRAIERRIRYNIPIDSSDLPVNPEYVTTLSAFSNLQILGVSKWLNAVIIKCDDLLTLSQISQLPFVKSINNIALRRSIKKNIVPVLSPHIRPSGILRRNTDTKSDAYQYGATEDQIKIHNGQILHNLGADGESMIIALFDAGYYQFNSNRFFDSVILKSQIIATRDFINNDSEVSEDDAHGLYCLSALAGNVSGEYVGSSPRAKYLLLRTEDPGSEQIIEEYFWGLGAEYADSCGADVFSSSVGYSTFDDPSQNHQYADLNGNSTIVTKMADKAASKGILVVTSAGNEAASSWKYMGAPADGDSVFAVGAVDLQKQIAGFSSFGPTSDGRIKPDGLSVGVSTALIGANQLVIYSGGTSFATPNLAGLISCLWQIFPDINNAQLMQTIRMSSDRFNEPDAQYGYGIPDMAKAIAILLHEKSNAQITHANCRSTLKWNSYDKEGIAYIVQKKESNESAYISLDTIYCKEPQWRKRDYLYEDPFISQKTDYRILQIIDAKSENEYIFTIDSATVTPQDLCNTTSITIYPNPIKNHFNIKFTSPEAVSGMQLAIYNAWGQLIKTTSLAKPYGVYISPNIELGNVTSGLYTVHIYEKGVRLRIEKIVVARK
jgi:hypothetical protein